MQQRNTPANQNHIRWGSSSTAALTNRAMNFPNVRDAYTSGVRKVKTVAQVENFIRTNAGSNFDIRGSGICPSRRSTCGQITSVK